MPNMSDIFKAVAADVARMTPSEARIEQLRQDSETRAKKILSCIAVELNTFMELCNLNRWEHENVLDYVLCFGKLPNSGVSNNHICLLVSIGDTPIKLTISQWSNLKRTN